MPNLGRSPLLIILVLFLFLFILLPLLNRGKSSALTDKERAQRTQEAMTSVSTAEEKFRKANGNYTDRIPDLILFKKSISTDLVDGFPVVLDTSLDAKTYLAQVASTVLVVNRTVTNGTLVKGTCLALKSAADDYCVRHDPSKPVAAPIKK